MAFLSLLKKKVKKAINNTSAKNRTKMVIIHALLNPWTNKLAISVNSKTQNRNKKRKRDNSTWKQASLRLTKNYGVNSRANSTTSNQLKKTSS